MTRPSNLWLEKDLLITGGSGSFGTAFFTGLAPEEYRRAICFSRGWLAQKKLRADLGEPDWMRWFIGDVRDPDRLYRAFNGVDTVIHAAALKDLDACSYNPSEAMRTNVNGTQNVIDACIARGVKRCLLISTDKAVAPSNLYGKSKAMAEDLWLDANTYAANDAVTFSVCRYGNVVGSSGSVVPVFRRMIAEGATSLPVTHPDSTRFWMEMPEVLKFVRAALNTMQGGEIFIPTLPSIRITDLCQALDRPYHITGLRKGEKIHETMGQEFDSGSNPWFLTVDEIRKSIGG